jgi:hypothetical protein
MLVALGPRLRRLSLHYQPDSLARCKHNHRNNLLPAILRHCPLVTHLAVDDLPLRTAEVLLFDQPLLCTRREEAVDAS